MMNGYYCCKNWEILEEDFIKVDEDNNAYEIEELRTWKRRSEDHNYWALIKFCPWCGTRIRRMPYSRKRPYKKPDWIAQYHVYDMRNPTEVEVYHRKNK